MLILYDFKCAHCDSVHEMLVPPSVRESLCPNCGKQMKRVISPVRSKLEGITGHFPDAADKWARQHEKAGGVTPDE